MEQKKLKPWVGLLFFAAVLAVLYFVCFPIQSKIGLLGVGVFFLGGYLLNMMSSGLMLALFPEGVTENNAGINGIITSKSIWLGFLIVSVMPAICEEAVHRGFILHTFKDVKKQWVIVLFAALIFGVFHLDLFRFLPTAVLGACMTWIMLKTGNLWMSALFHALNNLLPLLTGFAMKGATDSTIAVTDEMLATMVAAIEGAEWISMLSTIGVCLMLGTVAFPLLLAGTALMKKKGEKIKGKHVATVFIIAGACLVLGFAMLIGASVYLVMSQGIGM